MDEDSADLFERKAFEDLKAEGLDVTVTDRTVSDYWITIEGERFDAEDLYASLQEVNHSNDTILTFERKKMNILKKLGVVDHEGSSRWCMGAELGPNGEEFIKVLREELKSKGASL